MKRLLCYLDSLYFFLVYRVHTDGHEWKAYELDHFDGTYVWINERCLRCGKISNEIHAQPELVLSLDICSIDELRKVLSGLDNIEIAENLPMRRGRI